jgi:hypothetical protein
MNFNWIKKKTIYEISRFELNSNNDLLLKKLLVHLTIAHLFRMIIHSQTTCRYKNTDKAKVHFAISHSMTSLD